MINDRFVSCLAFKNTQNTEGVLLDLIYRLAARPKIHHSSFITHHYLSVGKDSFQGQNKKSNVF